MCLTACEGAIENPPSATVDLNQPNAYIKVDSLGTAQKPLREHSIGILSKRAPFGATADDYCQVIEDVDGHIFLIISKSGIHSAPSVTHLPSCWCFKDSVK